MANPLKLEVVFNGSGNLPDYIKTVIGSTDHLSKNLRQAQGQLKKLEFNQSQINKYRQYREQLDKTNDELKRQKQIVSDLKSQGDLAPLTAKQTRELAKAEKEVTKLNKAYDQQSRQLTATVQDLHQAGMSVNSLAQDESNLKDKIHQTNMQINKRKQSLETAQKAQAQYQKTQDMLNKGKAMAQKGLMVAGASAAALAIPVKLSIDFESSMADIAKVVDGLKDETGKITPAYTTMSKEIIAMSSRLPMAANDIAAIVAAGGQSGIAANELTRFAESAVKMGVAFDITAQESGQAMAEMRSAFRMSQDQVVVLADKINYLGNNTPAAAKGIMDIVKRVGPLGEVSGFASGSIAALGATMRGMGIQEEIAATGIQNMMLSLVAGESATKAQKAAYRELGFESAQVAKDMQQDAEATTLKILQAVKKLPKEEQAAMLQSMFGKESIKAIAPMLTNMDALQDNFNKVGDATKYAGSMEKEYAARAATTANKLKLALNAVQGLGITIGNNLLPIITIAAEKFSEITNRITEWANENPALAATLTKVAVGAVAIVGGISALALVLVTILGPLAFLKMTLVTLGGGAGIFSGALKLLIAPVKLLAPAVLGLGKGLFFLGKNALWATGKLYMLAIRGIGMLATGIIKTAVLSVSLLGKALLFMGKMALAAGRFMMANPIIIAITLLATAAYLIYKNWGPIKEFFGDIWGSIKTGASDAWSWVSSKAGTAWEGTKTTFAPVGSWFNSRWIDIKSAFSGGIKGISTLILNWSPLGLFYQVFAKVMSYFGIDLPAKFTGFGAMIIDGLKKGIVSKIDSLKATFSKIMSNLPDWAKKILDIHSPSRVFEQIGNFTMQGLANGINNTANQPLAATANVAQALPQHTAKVQPVRPIQQGRSVTVISQDTNHYHFQVSDKTPVKQIIATMDERDRAKNEAMKRAFKSYRDQE